MNNPATNKICAGSGAVQIRAHGLLRHLGLLFLTLIVMISPALAFPPAPTFTIHGIVRDPYGWALKATDQGTVVVKMNGTVIAQGDINEGPRAGENFRVLLPMDGNPEDPYRVGVVSPASVVTIEVQFPNQTIPITWLPVAKRTVGQPAGSLFIDFSIGQDSTGDGIPDAWKYWQLSLAGYGPGDPQWSLSSLGSGDFNHNGISDYHEYLAGSFATLNEEAMRLDITGFGNDGSAILSAALVVDKTYRVESSPDLFTWTPTNVRVDSAAAALASNFTAGDSRRFPLYSAAAIQQPKLFYRLVLMR